MFYPAKPKLMTFVPGLLMLHPWKSIIESFPPSLFKGILFILVVTIPITLIWQNSFISVCLFACLFVWASLCRVTDWLANFSCLHFLIMLHPKAAKRRESTDWCEGSYQINLISYRCFQMTFLYCIFFAFCFEHGVLATKQKYVFFAVSCNTTVVIVGWLNVLKRVCLMLQANSGSIVVNECRCFITRWRLQLVHRLI